MLQLSLYKEPDFVRSREYVHFQAARVSVCGKWACVARTPVLSHSLSVLNAPTANSWPLGHHATDVITCSKGRL